MEDARSIVTKSLGGFYLISKKQIRRFLILFLLVLIAYLMIFFQSSYGGVLYESFPGTGQALGALMAISAIMLLLINVYLPLPINYIMDISASFSRRMLATTFFFIVNLLTAFLLLLAWNNQVLYLAVIAAVLGALVFGGLFFAWMYNTTFSRGFLTVFNHLLISTIIVFLLVQALFAYMGLHVQPSY